MEDTDKFSGNELDETKYDDETLAVQEAVAANSVKNKPNRKRLILICILITTFIAISIVIYGKYLFPRRNKPEAVPMKISGIQITKLNSFIIPYSKGNNYSYISISVSLYLPEEAIRNEVAEKRNMLRGTIYELINRQAQNPGWEPSLQQLKYLIREGINEKLSAGKIRELFITEYLVI